MTISDNRVALPDLHNYEDSGLPDRSMAYGLKGRYFFGKGLPAKHYFALNFLNEGHVFPLTNPTPQLP